LTEYAVVGTRFHGKDYDHPQTGGANPASDSDIFGVRTYENTLVYAAMGTTVPFYWQAGDQGFNTQAWGLIRSDEAGNTERPSFTTLNTLMPEIPDGARVLRQLTFDDILTVTAFLHEQRLVVGIANASQSNATRTLTFDGFSQMTAVKGLAVQGSAPRNANIQIQRGAGCRHAVEVSLAPVSTLTLVLDATTAENGCTQGSGTVE
jgi:hypothetical protein